MRTKTKNTIYIIITIAVIGGLYFLLQKKPVQPVVPAPTPATTEEWLPGEVKKKEIKETGKGYTIDVFYPETNSSAVTKYMEDFVTDAVAQFKNDTSWITDPNLPKDESSIQVSLGIDYTSSRARGVQTYIFTDAQDTGGAHGIATTTTFSFLKTGEVVTMKNLFTDETAGMKALSDYAINEIKNRNISDDTWISQGAGPLEENYKSFVVGDEGITIYFDPYQVAAYAAGTQQVTVPFSVLRPYLNPDVISL